MATHVSYDSGQKLKALSNNNKGEAKTTSTHLITALRSLFFYYRVLSELAERPAAAGSSSNNSRTNKSKQYCERQSRPVKNWCATRPFYTGSEARENWCNLGCALHMHGFHLVQRTARFTRMTSHSLSICFLAPHYSFLINCFNRIVVKHVSISRNAVRLQNSLLIIVIYLACGVLKAKCGVLKAKCGVLKAKCSCHPKY